MRTLRIARFLAVFGVLLLPVPGSAQSGLSGTIAGVVKDTTGAVLPGVTVEASSPALIEKARSVATDGGGQYKIVELRPGIYTVTFTLTGFNVIRREGIELTTGFTANVNSDMQVGAIEETITLSGATPIVDTQNVRSQNVFSRDDLLDFPHLYLGSWSYPTTSRFLFEATGSYADDHMTQTRPPETGTDSRAMTELSTGYTYGSQLSNLNPGYTDYGKTTASPVIGRFAMSYITGSHAFEVGSEVMYGFGSIDANPNFDVAHSFRNRLPSALTQVASPYATKFRIAPQVGMYGQDQWTLRRLTLTLGVRDDSLNVSNPIVREKSKDSLRHGVVLLNVSPRVDSVELEVVTT